MDGSQFDALTRLAGEASTRRTTLRSAAGAAAASTLALVGLAALSGETDAAKRKRRRRCKKCEPRRAGDFCTTNEQCCTDKTNHICALGPGSGTSTICCGGTGSPCTGSTQCCRHFTCQSGFCRM